MALNANQWHRHRNDQTALVFASTKPGQDRAKGRPVRVKPFIHTLPATKPAEPLTYNIGDLIRACEQTDNPLHTAYALIGALGKDDREIFQGLTYYADSLRLMGR